MKSFIVAFLLLATVLGCFAQQATELKNGHYELVHLAGNQYQNLQINLRNNHRGVITHVVPYGCDLPVQIFASTQSFPVNSNYEYTKTANVSSPAFLDIPQKNLGSATTLYLSLLTTGSSFCSVYIVTHVKHTLNLIRLTDSVPQFGVFQPNTQVPALYHFLEYDLGGNDTRLDSLLIGVTNLHMRASGDDSVYSLYVSNTNSRPIEGKSTWQGINGNLGDSGLIIDAKDSQLKQGNKLWIGIEFKSTSPFQKGDLAHYSVVVHPNFGASRSNLDKPLILLDKVPQFGLTLSHTYTYFTLYVDKQVAGLVHTLSAKTEYGDLVMYVSSRTTRPDSNNYDFRGGRSVSLRYDQPTFVYVAVQGLPHVSGAVAYELTFVRNTK
ncbi:hypothetical protein ABK040_008154 [Willaertia magna]